MSISSRHGVRIFPRSLKSLTNLFTSLHWRPYANFKKKKGVLILENFFDVLR